MTILLQIPTLVLLCALQGADGSGKPEIPAFQLNAAEQERILDLFQATEEKISADGTVELTYDFEREDRSLGDDWFPSPGSEISGKVRWRRDWEGHSRGVSGGVIIADEGQWFHAAVWQPDVRMELTYVSFLGGRRGDMVAAVFAWSKRLRQRVGSNLGTQLVRIAGTRAVGGVGKAPTIAYEEHHKFGFELKEGRFSSLLNGRAKEQTDSKKILKKLGRGQVGLVWRGTISGIVPQVKIRGKLDLDWAADQIAPLRERLDQHRQEMVSAAE
jgi:hypothetical protein